MLIRLHVLTAFMVLCLLALTDSAPYEGSSTRPVRRHPTTTRRPGPFHSTPKRLVIPRRQHPLTRRTPKPYARPINEPRYLSEMTDEGDIRVSVVLKQKKHNKLELN